MGEAHYFTPIHLVPIILIIFGIATKLIVNRTAHEIINNKIVPSIMSNKEFKRYYKHKFWGDFRITLTWERNICKVTLNHPRMLSLSGESQKITT